MKGVYNVAKNPYYINIKDPSYWLFPTCGYNPDGSIAEEQRTIVLPEGMDRRFCFTDSLMRRAANLAPETVFTHEHHAGYETFFVETGAMDFYINGKKTRVDAGKIIHMQPFMAHGFVFLDNVQFRGTFHDWNCADDSVATNLMEQHNPDAKKDPKFFALLCSNIDLHMRERSVFEEVPAEQVPQVKDPAHPMARFDLDGAVMKMITARWENGGKKELWRAEMKPGFWAEWEEYPYVQDLFYITEGKVRFKIYDEEFTAGQDSLVKIPKYAPRSFVVEEEAVMYDIGGETRWLALLEDWFSIRKYAPERAKDTEQMLALKKKFSCHVAAFGVK